MAKANSKTQPTLYTVETLLSELEESIHKVHTVLHKFRRARPGSEAFRTSLCDLETELFNLNLKAQHAHEVVEGFEESLPDED